MAAGVNPTDAVNMSQLQSGNLFGTAKDDKGAPLPGATVTLSGNGATQSVTTDAEGGFRFLGLAPGSYGIKSELQGFSTVDYPNIAINVGRNTTIELSLSAAVEDVNLLDVPLGSMLGGIQRW